MELKHFRLIKSIAEEGSIANSSEKLFLTQSALSHQLRELEGQLGFKVFLRTRNKWELTEQGQELYKLSNDLFDKIEEGFASINHINKGSKGKIRIGSECYFIYRGLPSFMQKMAVLYPDIEVDLNFDSTYNPVPSLIAKEIDMAIATEKPISEKLRFVELLHDEVVCVMNKENIHSIKKYLDFPCFEEFQLFIHSYPLESVPVYAKYLKPLGVMPPKITEVPFLSLAFEMVEANMGVITLPKYILGSYNLSDQLVLKRIGANGLQRIHYLVYRDEDKTKPYIKDFIANIQEEFLDK